MNIKLSRRRDRSVALLFLLLIALSCSSSAVAQRRRPVADQRTSPVAVKRCSGGWSGVVRFSKVLKESFESDEPGIRKAKDRIKQKRSRIYNYSSRAVIVGSDANNPLVNTNVEFTDNELSWGEERVWDTCNARENGHWFIIESGDDRQTQAKASGPARHFGLIVNEAAGTYSFNLKFPDAEGTYKRSERLRRSGHCQPRNNEPWDRSTDQPTRVSGEGFSIDGHKIDPDDPNVLSGTKIWGDDGSGQVRTFVYQVTWYFTRCPGDLVITDLRFDHPKFPEFENWQEIVEQKGTIDGNRVRVRATVLNMSGETKYGTVRLKETYRGDKWNSARPDEILPESDTSIRLEAGEERELEYVWNTEGQAWFDDGRPHLLHRIKAELHENDRIKDEKVRHLNIAPKPVVLVHGLWSSAQAWLPLYPNLLTSGHSYQWKAFPVGEKPEKGKLNTGGAFLSADKTNDLYANADELAKYVRYAQEETNAWHVDIVAHSMGGLISRLYIHKLMPDVPDNRPLVKHLVMLGTPNAGSPCADAIDLKFGAFGERVQAIKDLKPENVAVFNRYVTDRKRVRFSALAGNPLPVMCGGYTWNDGVVSVESAVNGIDDFAYSNDIHTDLTDARNFGNFVLPHLVTGPGGTYPIPVKSDPNNLDRWKIGSNLSPGSAIQNGLFARVAHRSDSGSSGVDQGIAQEIKLGPKQSSEIEIPVAVGGAFGVTFLADAAVSALLLDQRGVAVAKNETGSPLSRVFFRSLFASKGVTAGTWKLRLENTSDVEQYVLAYSWIIPAASARPAPVAE